MLVAVRAAPRALWQVALGAGVLGLLVSLYGVIHPVGFINTGGASSAEIRAAGISAGWGLYLALLASIGVIATSVVAGRRRPA